jgi:hypothetical protein
MANRIFFNMPIYDIIKKKKNLDGPKLFLLTQKNTNEKIMIII